MTSALVAALHHTGPWYVAVPLVAIGLGLTVLRWRRGGGRGPSRGGPLRRPPFGGGPSEDSGGQR